MNVPPEFMKPRAITAARRPRRLLGASAPPARPLDDLEQRAQHFGHALAAHRGNHQRRLFGRALEPRHLLFDVVGAQRVGFVERDDLRLVRQSVAVGGKLGAHRLDRPRRHRRSVPSTRCSNTRQRSTWPRKPVAETDAFMRAFDQSRNVGEHEFAAVDIDHAELRMQRGERIIGDLRLGGADGGEEGRFAGVRQTRQCRHRQSA